MVTLCEAYILQANFHKFNIRCVGHQSKSTGTGFCIASATRQRLVLTNAHVVHQHTVIRVRRPGCTTKFVAKVRWPPEKTRSQFEGGSSPLLKPMVYEDLLGRVSSLFCWILVELYVLCPIVIGEGVHTHAHDEALCKGSSVFSHCVGFLLQGFVLCTVVFRQRAYCRYM